MDIEQRKLIYRKAIEQWGEALQCLMFHEESSELSILLSKYIRGKNPAKIRIAEEIADTSIVLEQLIYIFDVEEDVKKIKHQKLKRLLERAIDSETQQVIEK